MGDLRLTLRNIRKYPAYSLALVLTLALGTAAATLIFTVADTIAFRALPYPGAGRLVLVWDQLLKLGIEQFPVSAAHYHEYRARNRAFEELVAFRPSEVHLTGAGEPERLEAIEASPALLAILGAKPAVGRLLAPDDTRQRVALLSHELWTVKFGRDPAIAGRSVRLNGEPFTVVGVLAPSFRFAIRVTAAPQIWMPLAPPENPADRTAGNLRLLGRRKPGVTLEQARADMAAVAAAIEREHRPYRGPRGEDAGYRVAVVPLREQFYGSLRRGALALLAGAGLLWLMAAVNAAGLQLARGAARASEVAMRAALGAGRWQLWRLWMTESAALAVAGGCAGLLLAAVALPWLRPLAPAYLPAWTELRMDARILLFAGVVSLAAGLLSGLLSGWRATQPRHSALQRRATGWGRDRLRRVLVVAEVALAMALLCGAGLLVQSVRELHAVHPGFRPEQVTALRLALPAERYPEAQQRTAFFRDLETRLAAWPGMMAAGATSRLPLSGGGMGGDPFSIEGRPYDTRGRVPQVAVSSSVTPGYLRAMEIPLRRGRLLEERDGPEAPPVAVINETMARGFWPHENPLGKRIVIGAPRPGVRWQTIVGVAGDVRNAALDLPPIPQIYAPHAQVPAASMYVVVRGPDEIVAVTRRQIAALDPELPAFDERTLEQRLADSIARPRVHGWVAGFFAGAALLLAALGVYGVLAQVVAERTPELGLRAALGARPGDLLRLVTGHGMRLVALGLGVGMAGAVAAGRALAGLLFGVSPHDTLTFLVAAAVLWFASLAACLIPARRAARLDPMAALRCE